MKIELEISGETYSWKSDYEDHTIYDIAEKFKGLLVSAGFHPDNADDLFDLVHESKIKIQIHKEYNFDEIQKAHIELEQRKSVGKIIINLR